MVFKTITRKIQKHYKYEFTNNSGINVNHVNLRKVYVATLKPHFNHYDKYKINIFYAVNTNILSKLCDFHFD